ncbi:MAG: ABC transporter substrate-binding protein [Chloroflexi bacterium]|nr:ABC transporter substrate-binding protein [Chloroflexota bacterium]
MKSKIFIMFSILTMIALVLGGCQPLAINEAPPTTAPAQDQPKDGSEPVAPEPSAPTQSGGSTSKINPKFGNPDTLMVITGAGEPETLEPSWTYETAGSSIELNLYEGLVFFKREKFDEFIPALATEWTTSSDKLEMQFMIRPGIKFHKGGTLEPHDVAYTLQRSMLQGRLDGHQTILYETFFGPDLATASVKEFSKAYTGKENFEDITDAELKGICEDVKSKVIADDTAGTVTMKFHQPVPWILSLLAQNFMGAILDQEWMVENGDWDYDCTTWTKWADPAAEDSILFNQANGTGPYMLDHWTPNEEIVLTAFPDYWRKEPMWEGGPSGVAKISRVVVKNIDEWGTRLAMFEAGDADYIYVPAAYRPQMDQVIGTLCGIDESSCQDGNPDGYVKGFRKLAQPFITAGIMNWNINVEGGNPYIGSGELDGNGIPPDFFNDIHIRKAFNDCFDFNAMIEESLAGEGFQAQGPILKGMMGYLEGQPPAFSYDPAKCEQEFKLADLDKDGVPAGEDEDDVWSRGFYLQIAYNTGNDTRQLSSEILKAGVEAVNPKFNIAVVGMPWAVMLESRRQGKLPVTVVGWVEDFHDPHNWAQPFLFSQGTDGRAINLPADLSAQIDGLILQGAKETDPAKRKVIYENLQKISQDEVINIWMYQALDGIHWQKWVDGFFYNPAFGNAEAAFFYGLTKVAP